MFVTDHTTLLRYHFFLSFKSGFLSRATHPLQTNSTVEKMHSYNGVFLVKSVFVLTSPPHTKFFVVNLGQNTDSFAPFEQLAE